MGVAIANCISTCGSWPQVVGYIEIMLLDDRIDAFSIEWVDENSLANRSSIYSVVSAEEFHKLALALNDRLAGFQNFDLCRGEDISTHSQNLRLLRIIAS